VIKKKGYMTTIENTEEIKRLDVIFFALMNINII